MSKVRVKRAYDSVDTSDGRRILVDRVWPRGISKADLRIDIWVQAVAPSTELRKWFGHDPTKWHQFKIRYFAELDQQPEGIDALLTLVREGPVTLVFGAKNEIHNNAVALKEYIERQLGQSGNCNRG